MNFSFLYELNPFVLLFSDDIFRMIVKMFSILEMSNCPKIFSERSAWLQCHRRSNQISLKKMQTVNVFRFLFMFLLFVHQLQNLKFSFSSAINEIDNLASKIENSRLLRLKLAKKNKRQASHYNVSKNNVLASKCSYLLDKTS